ncbi:uncharacterized protein BCR38DRAFT_436867 [Pseudomassariella vexata]|uniref:Uncharacterized protein n=1 Tax=Pseudomassariella vexata TaxID=1141098 RepID=A0A1Y2DWC9_9PEZI|nr:uncharacterized protein BCR38DRAFT_436867 [Pseudomassariella vexata]ORY63446.1 hypothetical protein BCR38DRAFT_436867 [Pseudomassariella vexata]
MFLRMPFDHTSRVPARSFLCTFDPTREPSVYFEDALEELCESPLLWIHDWEGLYRLLEILLERQNALE